MNYLSNKNARDTYLVMLSGVRKGVPRILRPYINITRLVGMRYEYIEDYKDFMPTINTFSYSPDFVHFLVILASVRRDYNVLNMYLDKFQNKAVQSKQLFETKEGIDILVESRVPSFDLNLTIFKKLLIAVNSLHSEEGNFWYINSFILYLTNKNKTQEYNQDLVKLIQDGSITNKDLYALRDINPNLAEFYLKNYDSIKRHSYFSLSRRLEKVKDNIDD